MKTKTFFDVAQGGGNKHQSVPGVQQVTVWTPREIVKSVMVAAERETMEGGREVRVVSRSLCDPTQANLVFIYSFASIAHFVFLTECEEQA